MSKISFGAALNWARGNYSKVCFEIEEALADAGEK